MRKSSKIPPQGSYAVEALREFWVTTAESRPPCEAIASDIASFTGEPLALAIQKMADGKEAFRDLWLQQHVNAADSEAVAAFYKGHFIEAYELANCRAGKPLPTIRKTDLCPVWSWWNPGVQLLEKRPWGAFRNRLATLKESVSPVR